MRTKLAKLAQFRAFELWRGAPRRQTLAHSNDNQPAARAMRRASRRPVLVCHWHRALTNGRLECSWHIEVPEQGRAPGEGAPTPPAAKLPKTAERASDTPRR